MAHLRFRFLILIGWLFALAVSAPVGAQSGSISGTLDQADFARATRPEDEAAMLHSRALRQLAKAEKLEAKLAAGKEIPESKITKCRERALGLLKDAVGKMPTHFEAFTELGQTQLLLENPEGAKSACGAALGLKPEHEPARTCLIAAYEALGQTVELDLPGAGNAESPG